MAALVQKCGAKCKDIKIPKHQQTQQQPDSLQAQDKVHRNRRPWKRSIDCNLMDQQVPQYAEEQIRKHAFNLGSSHDASVSRVCTTLETASLIPGNGEGEMI